MVQQTSRFFSVSQLSSESAIAEETTSLNVRASVKKSTNGLFSDSGTLDLEELRLPSTALARLPAGLPPDNLLKSAVQSQDITLTINAPPDLYTGDTLTLYVDGIAGTPISVENYAEGEPIPVPLPASLRPEGRHEAYAELFYFIGNNYENSPVLPFIVDLTPPGRPFLGRLEVDSSIVRDGLTPDKLSNDGQGNEFMRALVPGYSGQAIGDVIFPIIGEDLVGGGFLVTAADIGKDIEIHFTREQIEFEGDGILNFSYLVSDRAGNNSSPAEAISIRVLLAGAIDDLLKPDIPSSADGIIDEADARGPARVIIPGNTGIQPGDSIVLKWGNSTLSPIPVPAGSEGNDPLLEFTVPYGTVYSEWKRLSAGADRLTPLDVSYEVLRNGLPAGESPAQSVSVNLYQAGGDPDPEKPVHDKLIAPTVLSASGQSNTIPVEDAGKDATVIVPWFNNEATPVDVFIAGDDVIVCYGTTQLALRTISGADVIAQQDLEILLPAATIVAQGSGEIQTWYTVSRTVQGGSSNTVTSPSQTVTVVGKDTLPGGENGLAAGDFRPVNARGAIGRSEANAGVKFYIPDYLNRAIGDRIVLNFALYAGANHVGGETPVSGTELVLSKTVGPDDLAGEIGIDIPASILLLPNRLTHAHGIYTITNSYGPVTSAEKIVIVDSRGS